MQEQPGLVSVRLVSKWIERNYPAFCRSLGLTWWPPFTEFASELKKLMPPKRCEVRRGGKRVGTVTAYLVPDPAVPAYGAQAAPQAAVPSLRLAV
jgi:hypothetical protein